MAKYQAYAEYKDTDIDMLAALPVSWQTKQVRYLLKDGAEGIKIGPFGSALKLEDMVDTGTRVYGQENVINKDFTLGTRRISEAKFDEMQVYKVTTNDLLVTMMGTSGKCELVSKEAEVGIIDSHLLRLRVKDADILPRFFRLLIDECYEIENQIKIAGKGSIMHGLNSSIVKSLTLPLPTPVEQETILNFLDHETAKIDTLIEKQQLLITLLKEKRQAVISHAVTKGLNPNVPMRDSGVEWLGEVPAHWLVSSLGYYAQISTGATPDRAKPIYWGGEIPWIKTGEVRYEEILDTEEYITEDAVANSSVKISPPGTLLMAMYGQGITRGRVAILGVAATYNQACAAITPNEKIWNQYLRYFFMAAYHAIRDGGNETSQMNLNADIVSKFKISIPDLDSQHQIVDYLNDKLEGFDVLLKRAESVIGLMQERRTALISAAVTGKIDVRNWQAA